ncbi:MAG: LemA family protein [Bacteroidetes bacterium]|nr:LemA family protein [Bacteroidota bacterium]
MKSGSIIAMVVVALLAIFFFMGCNGYNGLVTQDEVVKKAWNNVQTEYQNRADLVPNLVNTVKGAANFEQETLSKVIEARSKASSVQLTADQLTPENIAKFQQAQSELSGALIRLLVTVERYPELKAVQGFQDLQKQLEGIENSIKNSRKTFNDAVNTYNVKVRSFPMNILAGFFNFKVKEGFQAEAGAEKAPEVKF